MNNKFDSKSFLASLTHKPGVYHMLDNANQILYVGKARDLKKRVSSYFGSKAHHPKTMALMNRTCDVQFTVTTSEQEALLLELNLIKEHQPYFNVLMRDDKSYPYIYVSTEQNFPRFLFHRGARRSKGRYLGPFPNSSAVRQTLSHTQKLFRIRQCEDSFFSNRTRPCLQHQIRRCSAPCVGLIDKIDYQRDVDNAILFLQGRDDTILKNLAGHMDTASDNKNYEEAALYRDQIAAVKSLQTKQSVTSEQGQHADALAVVEANGNWAIATVMVRNGRVLGSRNFFPHTRTQHDAGEVMAAFLAQHYSNSEVPQDVIVNAIPDDPAVLEEMLSIRHGSRVSIRTNVRGTRRDWLDMAAANAREALLMQLAGRAGTTKQLQELAQVFGLKEAPTRIECFDISHTSGEHTVASCVVFGPEGAIKADYRRFNIKDVKAGDDYAAIAQVIQRRYTRLKNADALLPDLILVDGGKGQLIAAAQELNDIQLDGPLLAAVAKGPDRRAGEEIIHIYGSSDELDLPPDSPALHLIQQIRDEAHRFAITAHRQRRSKARQKSPLEGIPGIGPKKRRELLRHFGGLQSLRQAGVSDLRKVQGISLPLAELIYDRFHDGSATTTKAGK
ncbi:MAG: excinuclease ABC subunit UvrC [Gammaproteobacteria bacterium]|nr:excinuclease ABC subunit UvrC [Gammaproteobacteria bacterium]MCP4090459.1 excinuclease ABC subunit UvrC [Gammaproteobacteria bacterium]MCP4275434.1 excinuclease ABC subunit UvrC [Gammaproteobacteria bacterium]MCP4832589.1 excinuclease ABC subunit UvrC [Gammaproteobacteria bacterium]